MSEKSNSPRVIALLRVSTEEQAADDRAGLDRQRESIARTVIAHKLDVIRTVTLIDVSGANVLLNPEYISMLDAVGNKAVDGVVVSDIDRLVRATELTTAAAITGVFQTAQAKIYCEGSVHDYATDDGIFLSQIQTLMGGNNLRKIKKQMQDGKEEVRKKGGCPSSPITLPLGVTYDRAANLWSYTDDVCTVKDAFRLIDEEGMTNISAIAEKVGIQNRTLHYLLRNPIYTGWRVYDKKRGDVKYYKADGKQADRKKVARAEPIRVKVIEVPAVSQERFDRVQKLLDKKGTKWRRARIATEVNLGTGIAVCGHCGQRLYASSGKRKEGSRIGYYYCAANDYLNRRKGMKCQQPNISKPMLEETLIKFTAEHLASEEIIGKLAEKLHAPTEVSTRPALEKKLVDIDRRKKRLLEGYEAGAIELPDLKSRKAELESEAGTIRRLIQSEIERNRIREQADDSLHMLVTACVGFSRITNKAEQHAALRGLFAKIAFENESIVGCELLIPGIRPVCSTEIGIRKGRGSSRRRA
jgi:DNA invertase Pin-like site-specific DNA recombinase